MTEAETVFKQVHPLLPDFTKAARLLTPADYSAVFNNAQFKVSSKHFLVLAISNHLDNPRLGLVIAKKNVSLAVHRNRIKRLLRNAFRLNKALIKDLDIVVLARNKSGELDNAEITRQIDALWHDLVRKVSKQKGAKP